jgi:hypothetical protein
MGRRRGIVYSDSVLIVYGREALVAERKAAERLAHVLAQRAGVRTLAIDDQRYDPEGWQTLVLVGHPDRQLVAAALMAIHGIRRPTDARPGPEGYIVQRIGRWRLPTVVIAGSGRGCLYGVGAFLRSVNLDRPGYVGIPYLKISSAPAFPIRGSDLKFWQEQRATDWQMGQWTLEQWEQQIADLGLWGINLVRRQLLFSSFDAWLDEQEMMIEDGLGQAAWEIEKQVNQLIHDYGLQVGIRYAPNTVSAAAVRDDWHVGSTWPRLVCPSVSGAHDRILYERLLLFKELEHIDHLFLPPYEVGACECDRCQPWSQTYLKLVKETASFLHRHHPNAQVWISNQGFSPEESEWLWQTLAQERHEWLQVMQYGPTAYGFSSNGVVPDTRQPSGTRRYPAMGTLTRNLQETVRRIPVRYTLVLGPDVTHTFQPQYGMEYMDPALLWLHTYESPFARPLGYHEIFRATASASAGVALYSEGLYDDLNKALWAGWTWSPDLSPWEATMNYARWWFGDSAAQFVAEAILLSESNWESPLVTNDQVEQVVLQLDQADLRIPEHLREGNWRWTMWRLRGLLDLLAHHKLTLANELEQDVHHRLSETLENPRELVHQVQTVIDLLDLEQREARLKWLKEEIQNLDKLLFEQIGLHLPAAANLNAELANLGWERNLLKNALNQVEAENLSDLSGLRRAIRTVLTYEEAGPGGFYDNCGHIGLDPHFISGHRIPGVFGLDPGNRPSANTFAVDLGEAKDIVFAYQDLNPRSDYQLRLTLVCPEVSSSHFELLPSMGSEGSGPLMCAAQRLYASGFLVHGDLYLPHRVAQQYTFDVPRQAYSDGRLELRFVRVERGNMAAVSEIWLMQRNSNM